MLKATPQDLSKFADVEFRKDDFDSSIWRYGYDMVIEKAVRCPCEGVDGIPLSNCNNCHGTGYFYINPIQTIGLVSGVNRNTKYKEWSAELIGTISISVRDNIHNTQEKVAFYDRITLMRKRAEQAQIFGYHSEVLRIRKDSQGNQFLFLSYKPQEIIDLFYFINGDSPLIKINNYEISTNNPYVLKLNQPIIVENNVISIRYKHDLQYHVIDIPHEVRYSTERDKMGRINTITLPTNVICRRSHLVQIKQNYDGSGINNNTYL